MSSLRPIPKRLCRMLPSRMRKTSEIPVWNSICSLVSCGMPLSTIPLPRFSAVRLTEAGISWKAEIDFVVQMVRFGADHLRRLSTAPLP